MGEDPSASNGPQGHRANREFPSATVRQSGSGEFVTSADGMPVTQPLETNPTPLAGVGIEHIAPSEAPPSHIGRYRVIRKLGRGGFGTVYLARDELSDRSVAIKVPRSDRLNSTQAIDAFLREARHVARLKHPGIVTLYDCGQADGTFHLVYEYIEGESLLSRIRRGSMPFEKTALLVAQVADALHHAHSQNLYHRDIKPGNILLDRVDQPHVTDFGIALREDELGGERGGWSGTVPYISPEAVRGEGHRIDGRSDIYSLGIVLYELLCGRLPFDRASEDILDQIQHRDPRPPRQINDTIPRELERICLKAIAKQLTARYATAHDLAEDLRHALTSPVPRAGHSGDWAAGGPPQAPSAESLVPRVVPKGLRPFEAEDSEFFIELLPGPRDREGMPDCIRFWKNRIDGRDRDHAFAVGLIYGPSGCGKSSLVRAGLLPRLGSAVKPIYVEAAREETEARLANALQKSVPGLGVDLSLPEMVMRLRRGGVPGHDGKLLIVLDQFEQWLHARGHAMETTDLFAALRQADGHRVQVVLLVRDDFWMGITRLFEKLEIDLDRERNTYPVDLFDLQHAKRVLLLLGQAHNRLPLRETGVTPEQASFVDRAVHELSEQGRVISVRLSLFAELMKARPWTVQSLVEVGGTAGVGVRFLEETFTSRSAVPDHRAYEKPARAVLQALLPEPGVDIKGHLRSRVELADASGLDSRRFHRLIEILDRELHVITPTEVAEDVRAEGSAEPAFYQLTHDYLVPPLRNWLTLERRRTWRGRAELCLEERAAQMTKWPQSRYLPSPLEFVCITMGVPRARRKPEQRTLMSEATRHYVLRWGAVAAVMVIILFSIATVRGRTRRESAEVLVKSVLNAPAEAVQYTTADLIPYESLAIPLLVRIRDEPGETEPLHRLRAAFALARFRRGDWRFLLDAVPQAPHRECGNFVTALSALQVPLHEIQKRFHDAEDPRDKVRFAVLLLHLGEPREAVAATQIGDNPTLRTRFIHALADWHGNLGDLANALERVEDGAFRSAVAAALGLIPIDRIAPDELTRFKTILTNLYATSPDGGTHSTADWTMRRWGMNPATPSASDKPESARRWFVTSNGLTMIQVPPGSFVMHDPLTQTEGIYVEFKNAYFVSDREIPVRLFREFIEDPDYRASEKPENWPMPALEPPSTLTMDHPAQQVTWYDAVLFCNWLSQKEGLARAYTRTGQFEEIKSQTSGLIQREIWSCDYDKPGYRLLTEAEWEYAGRAGSKTAFITGESGDDLGSYAVFQGEAPARCASRLPNAFGLFDMPGNLIEWCWNAVEEDEAPERWPTLATGKRRAARGGVYNGPAAYCRNGVRFRDPPTARYSTRGLRVMRAARAP